MTIASNVTEKLTREQIERHKAKLKQDMAELKGALGVEQIFDLGLYKIEIELCDLALSGLDAAKNAADAQKRIEELGVERVWHYHMKPHEGTDLRAGNARRFVHLNDGNMEWLGIRAWHQSEQRWYNGNEPERADVKAWAYLPNFATGSWDRAKLMNADDMHPEEARALNTPKEAEE